ncbi:hypothetical protein Scep_009297 [Stephania cephalantha]|uniref:Uncharacterized protein n=1 Tax=Stephania cephalantha TaxID=152367 RepID=A0AAP0PG52_9MAGN
MEIFFSSRAWVGDPTPARFWEGRRLGRAPSFAYTKPQTTSNEQYHTHLDILLFLSFSSAPTPATLSSLFSLLSSPPSNDFDEIRR